MVLVNDDEHNNNSFHTSKDGDDEGINNNILNISVNKLLSNKSYLTTTIILYSNWAIIVAFFWYEYNFNLLLIKINSSTFV